MTTPMRSNQRQARVLEFASALYVCLYDKQEYVLEG